MIRAGIFVGVDRTGNLQELHDAAAGARRMYDWAVAQGIAKPSHAKLITDEGGQKVGPDLIADAIKAILDGPGVDQLILYFAGHGVNIARSEYWLLSEAPVKAYAAVNVNGSADLARYCGAGHVVVISDACRVAPEGIQAQGVRGVEVFPNDPTGDRAKPVDQFYACLLGRTAAEIKDPALAAGNYRALYTDALLDALYGRRREVLEPSPDAADDALYVRQLRLESYLEGELRRRVKESGLVGQVNQSPDALLAMPTPTSTWISRVPAAQAAPADSPRKAGFAGSAVVDPARSAARRMVTQASRGDRAALKAIFDKVLVETSIEARSLARAADQMAMPFGPDHMDTECGIKVRGARIVSAEATGARVEVLDAGLVRLHDVATPGASVLLRFEGGVGTVIPAIPGFLAALSFMEGDLADVAFEPSANNWRWPMYQSHADDVRALRAVAASATLQGRFRLDEADAAGIAQRMQYAKGIDPSLAVYAAYAYNDLQAIERIKQMSGYMSGDIGVRLFDVALLARELLDTTISRDSGVLPFVPMLAQGWSLLRANRVRLPTQLVGLDTTLTDSLWSLYDTRGVEMLSRALQAKEIL